MKSYRVGYLDVDGEATAVFLDSGPDCRPGFLMAFARMGEHGEAELDWVRKQPLADPDIYEDLHTYLARRYGSPPGGEPLMLVIDQAGIPRA